MALVLILSILSMMTPFAYVQAADDALLKDSLYYKDLEVIVDGYLNKNVADLAEKTAQQLREMKPELSKAVREAAATYIKVTDVATLQLYLKPALQDLAAAHLPEYAQALDGDPWLDYLFSQRIIIDIVTCVLDADVVEGTIDNLTDAIVEVVLAYDGIQLASLLRQALIEKVWNEGTPPNWYFSQYTKTWRAETVKLALGAMALEAIVDAQYLSATLLSDVQTRLPQLVYESFTDALETAMPEITTHLSALFQRRLAEFKRLAEAWLRSESTAAVNKALREAQKELGRLGAELDPVLLDAGEALELAAVRFTQNAEEIVAAVTELKEAQDVAAQLIVKLEQLRTLPSLQHSSVLLQAIEELIADLKAIAQDAQPAEIAVHKVTTGNKQAQIEFAIEAAKAKGYDVYLSSDGDSGNLAAYSRYDNLSINSKGVQLKGLTNGKAYHAYVTYGEGGQVEEQSAPVSFLVVK